MNTTLPRCNPALYIWLILLIAAFSRLYFIYFFQAEAGDTSTYVKYAENIIRGCGLSHSDPNSGECILTSGGYFPGYPAFIASVWILFGKSVFVVLIVQLICYLIALNWLLVAIKRLTQSNKVMSAVGILLALSPLQIGWFRFILTEPLAITTATWFLAELIISLADKKLRVFQLALALSASIYVRPDSIFMVLGACLISFYIYDLKKSIQQILLLITLTSIPVSAWLIRNYSIGHAPISMTSSAAPNTPGYFLWLDTWIVNEYERSDANFPVWRKEYSKINIHASRYISGNELLKAKALISELDVIDGHNFPKNVDQKFNSLAVDKIKNRSKLIQIQIYSERVFWLLLNPFSSWGLPLEMNVVNKSEVSTAIKKLDLVKLNHLLSGYKEVIFWKIASLLYRLLMCMMFLYLLVNVTCKSALNNLSMDVSKLKPLILATGLVAIIRVSFFVFVGCLESRYLVSVLPWIECCLFIYLMNNYSRKINFVK